MTQHREDLRLAERMLAGDEAAFEAFGGRYFGAVYRFASHRLAGDAELTREIVQTALCKALSKLDTYRGDASLATWLCACCHNEVRMHYRRLRRAPAEVLLDPDEGPAHALEAPEPGPQEASLLRHEEAERVHVALELLPAHYARALEWKYMELLPVREIARRLELGEKAAESLLTRARQAFRVEYEGLAGERGRPRSAPALEGASHG